MAPHDYGGRWAALGLGGVNAIAWERHRQINAEGWTAEHDDEHTAAELATAAAGYTWHAVGQINGVCWSEDDPTLPPGWPWNESWWKPSDDPIRNLVKAGALIAAEIDRLLQRVASNKGTDRG